MAARFHFILATISFCCAGTLCADDGDTNAAIASCQTISKTSLPNWHSQNANVLLAGSVQSKPYKNPRGQSGKRLQGSLQDGTQIVWTSIQSGDDLVAMQITTSKDERPRNFWQLNGDCEPSQQRRIVYNDEQQATQLHIIDHATGEVVKREQLNPQVPPAPQLTDDDTNRVRVAMVDAGVNYTLPTINNRLARNDDGELIGYDFWENDKQPFDAHFSSSAFHIVRHGTATASLLLAEAPNVELVPYRYPRPDMTRMSALVEHAAANDVRIVGIPLGGNRPDQWRAFEAAAKQHPDILFIASAGNNGRNIDQQPVYPAALDLPNLLVVTSADDFVVPAERVNWGRTHVDYMLPAEQLNTSNFRGEKVSVSGSSYAVPRALAMAARWLQQNPTWRAPELISEFARRYADGSSARYVGGGYIADPLASDELKLELIGVQTLARDKPLLDEKQLRSFKLPLSVFVLHDAWSTEQVNSSILEAEAILNQCQIAFNSVTISKISVPEYLQDLATGPSRTLLSALQNDSEFKPIKVFFARDTHMLRPTDGAAFGRGNTRRRPWLQDSVWLMENIEDAGIALAHELFHVLSNSGEHNRIENNLMQARTSPENTQIQSTQCEAAITQAKNNLLLFD